MKIKLLFLVIILCLCLPSYAGTISDFEKDVSEDTSNDKPTHSSKKISDSDKKSGFFGELLFEIISLPIRFGGTYSLMRVAPALNMAGGEFNEVDEGDEEERKHFTSLLRHDGESLIPFARADLFYHSNLSDVQSANVRVELGFGPGAIELRFGDFRELGGSERFTLSSLNFLYRMSFGTRFELDLGLGAVDYHGISQRYGGMSFVMPILFHLNQNLGFEFRPTWIGLDSGGGFNDYLLGLHVGRRYFAGIVGYRWMESNKVSINGPVLGGVLKW